MELLKKNFFLFICRHRQHVGFIDDSHQPTSGSNRLIVSSQDNVVASIDLPSRKIGKYLLLPVYFCINKHIEK